MDNLPIPSNSIDFIFSNLTIQWSLDLNLTIKEFCRVLKPNGLLLFSTLGVDTFYELKTAFKAVDNCNGVGQQEFTCICLVECLNKNRCFHRARSVEKFVFIDEDRFAVLEVFKGQGKLAGLGVEFGFDFFAELASGELLAMHGKCGNE